MGRLALAVYLTRGALGGVCALALCQCGSLPEIKRVVTLETGDAVRVVYRDEAKGVALTLQNESIETAEALYSSGNADPFVKVARDPDLQALLDALATYHFFDFARPTRPEGARAALVVEINKQLLTWQRQVPSLARPEDLEDFNKCSGLFLATYNSTDSFHAGIGMTREDLERQRQALQQQGSRIIKTGRQ